MTTDELVKQSFAALRAGTLEIRPGKSNQLALMRRLAPDFINGKLWKASKKLVPVAWDRDGHKNDSIENIMKAFIVDCYGSKAGVRFGEMPEPELRDDDVLVQIHAAGVNLLDSKIRDGEFKLILRYRLPVIWGNDVGRGPNRISSAAIQARRRGLCAASSGPDRHLRGIHLDE